MKALFTFLLLSLLSLLSLQAQQVIFGQVQDREGANIYLKDTYHGATPDLEGNFHLNTEEKGTQLLLIRYISFETQAKEVQLDGTPLEVTVVLKEAINKLEGVTITAGAFGAGDEKKATSLAPPRHPDHCRSGGRYCRRPANHAWHTNGGGRWAPLCAGWQRRRKPGVY